MKTILGTMALALALTAAPARAEPTDDMAAMAGRQLYAEGRYDEAVAVIRPLAERGVPRAMAIYGFFFERGLGVAQDAAQALAWYEKAAAAGSPVGIHNLARAYEIGDLGVAADLPKARALYATAAALDYLPSVHNLARMMIYGEGGPQDVATGRAYLERAVSLGYAEGTADMAYMLATGDGLPVDLPRARDLYETAAGHRIDWAMRDFAEMLELGQGGEVDLDRAWFWYVRAAEADYAMAGMDLAEMAWANPEALADRRVEALAWCYWAEAQPADVEGTEYEGRCAEGEAAHAAEEIAAAREMAAGL